MLLVFHQYSSIQLLFVLFYINFSSKFPPLKCLHNIPISYIIFLYSYYLKFTPYLNFFLLKYHPMYLNYIIFISRIMNLYHISSLFHMIHIYHSIMVKLLNLLDHSKTFFSYKSLEFEVCLIGRIVLLKISLKP